MQSSTKLDETDGEGEEEDTNELLEKEENLRQLLEDSKRMLIVEPEQCMGGWCLINADPVYVLLIFVHPCQSMGSSIIAIVRWSSIVNFSYF